MLYISQEESEPVVAESSDFENRVKAKWKELFGIIGLSRIQLTTEWSSASGKASIETLVGNFIPVVNEKYEFDYRNKSILLNFFKFSDYRDYDVKKIRNIGAFLIFL